MIKRQDETGALSCRISCCPPSVKRGGYLLPSFHPVPSSGGGPGNSFGEVAFIWRQNILIYLKRKVLTMHWMYIYLSVGDHNEYISIGLDRSQPLFYFVPQEKGLIWRPLWGRKNMGESIFHWEDGPPWGKMHPNWCSNMPRNKF